jgi:hypothetical protein
MRSPVQPFRWGADHGSRRDRQPRDWPRGPCSDSARKLESARAEVGQIERFGSLSPRAFLAPTRHPVRNSGLLGQKAGCLQSCGREVLSPVLAIHPQSKAAFLMLRPARSPCRWCSLRVRRDRDKGLRRDREASPSRAPRHERRTGCPMARSGPRPELPRGHGYPGEPQPVRAGLAKGVRRRTSQPGW